MNKTVKIFWSIFFMITGFLLIFNISRKNPTLEAARRPYQEYDYVIIVDPPVPLGKYPENYILSADIVDNINKEREEIGLNDLIYSNGLTSAGQVRAQECEDLFSHTRPDGSDWYTVNETIMFGENLSMGYDTADDVVQAWMDSQTHRELIYDEEFQTCGVGIYKGKDNIMYIAGEFGY